MVFAKMRPAALLPACWLALGCTAVACNPKRSESERAAPVATTTAAASAAAASASARPKLRPPVYHVPVGPAFGIEPGVGIGPIRFGATLSTIERLMELPCPEKTASGCRYPIHAVEFQLKDGALEKIHIHGQERLVKPDTPGYTYGIFNGKLLNGVELGMYRDYVEDVMGAPPAGRDVQENGSAFPTVYVAEYPGVTFQYDKLKNGNVVLAGIVLEQSAAKAAPGPSAKARPKPPLH